MRILIVEDSPSDMRLASAIFASPKHVVMQRISAEQALRHLPSDRPDIIVLDLRLPEMNGLAFAKKLRDAADTRDIPVVAVTAYPDTFTREQALAAGCTALVVKPVDTRSLPATIAKIARSGRDVRLRK